MSERPLFSIVIPTRERDDTLSLTLKTCIAQKGFDDFEILVCDNFSSSATREVVEAAASPNIKYIRTSRPLAMSDNWEYALSEAAGEYLTILGDDDGMMPFAMHELSKIVTHHYDRPPAVHWHRGIYTWPTIAVPEDANFLRLPMFRFIEHRDGREQLLRATRYELGADMLPMIYNSVIRRDVVAILRETTGRVFPNLYPDIYSGYAFAFIAAAYLTVGVPMNIAGLSGKSNGVATLMKAESSPIAEEFMRLHRDAGIGHHPTVPNTIMGPVFLDDCFQFAKDRLFPQDEYLSLDRKRMAERYLAAIPHSDPTMRAHVRTLIRGSLADRPDLLGWFDELPDMPPAPLLRLKPERFGFDGSTLTVDTTAFEVHDIAQAVDLAVDLLGIRDGLVSYDLRPQGS